MLVCPGAGVAQTDFALELGGSQIGPPIGMQGETARFVVGGTTFSHYRGAGTGLTAGLLFGQSLDSTVGGSFLSGTLDGHLAGRWARTITGSLDVRVFGYGAQEPFPYRAFGVEGGPSLRFRSRLFGARISAIGGIGLSQIELWRVAGGPTRVFENDLWRRGAAGELTFGPLRTNLTLAAGWQDTPVGAFTNAGARLAILGDWGIAEFRIDRWDTPDASETTGGLAIAIPIGSLWSLRSYFGRTDPDPLTLVQPGSGAGSILLSRSLYSTLDRSSGSARNPMTQVLEYGDESSTVRIELRPPGEPAEVQLLGDFSLWEPMDMEHDGDVWAIEVRVPNGTHHFGYMVDGEWYVPDDAPDVIPDEWGRSTATLVIEGASR